MNYPLTETIKVSLLSVIVLYGSWGVFTEVLRTIFPFGIILALLVACAIYFLRVPPPSMEAVETIVGKEIHEENGGYVMKTVAHRGAGLDAPENSLEAFNMCHEKGCDAIEFDVTLTKDDVPIVFHDNNVERMSDLNMVIKDQKWADLANIDISVKHPFKERFTKTNIPTLEQTVTQLLANGQRMFIDIKDNNTKLVKIIHNLYEKYPALYSTAVVTTFFPNIIYLIRRGDPKIVCSLGWRPHIFAYGGYIYPGGKVERRYQALHKHYFFCLIDILHDWAFSRIIYYILGLSIVLLHKDVISGKTVLDWRKRGVRVMAWTVNSPSEKQFLARCLKITYLTDTLTGEGTTHSWIN